MKTIDEGIARMLMQSFGMHTKNAVEMAELADEIKAKEQKFIDLETPELRALSFQERLLGGGLLGVQAHLASLEAAVNSAAASNVIGMLAILEALDVDVEAIRLSGPVRGAPPEEMN